MRTAIIDALEARYEAQILEADATLKIYLENSVGIGEHPQHLDEIDKLVSVPKFIKEDATFSHNINFFIKRPGGYYILLFILIELFW